LSSPSLADLLAAAQDALDRDDPAATARAVDEAARTCAALAAAGVPPDPALRRSLGEQHARLTARALEVRQALVEQLETLHRSSRAAAAYRRR
jgi:hypothetical protein